MVQELQAGDYGKRLNFAKEMMERFKNFNNIIFSDEAHFHLSGELNKQNGRYYSEENPRVIVESGLHPKRCTAWVGLAAWGLIGPFFYEDDDGRTATARYLDMLKDFVTEDLQHHRGHNRNTWFQQDGAPPHRTKA